MQEREVRDLRDWLDLLEITLLSHDRHLLLEKIVTVGYKYRHRNANMRRLAECVGMMHFEEFEDLLAHIPIYANNRIFPPVTFPILATLLTESGRYKEAIAICQKSIDWGLSDGTKSGFRRRIERIAELAEKYAENQDSAPLDCGASIQHIQAELDDILRKIENQRDVPVLNTWQTELSVKTLDDRQREFYKRWVTNWKQETPIDIEYQVGYVFLYIQSDLLKQISEETVKALIKLREWYGADQPDDLRRLRYYCGAWASDCCVYLGQYNRAIAVFPELYINHLLSLKVLLDEDLSGGEVLRLFGQTSLTEYGQQHSAQVEKVMEELLHEYREINGASIIEQWANQADTQKYRLFNSSSRFLEVDVTAYQFVDSSVKETFISKFRGLMREAENRVRETRGIARIGEGWVSETQLYYEIKQAFPHLEVQHHASPKWLGRQHLDIFIPELLIAIEYQGRQHDEPIHFFGGEFAFRETLKRDATKRRLCYQNGVKLMEVRPEYRIEDILERIQSEADISG